MQKAQRDLTTLQTRLGYVFRASPLLELALTHKSYVHEGAASVEHNERLEFLGDSILGAVVSASLYQSYPDDSEGQLSKLKAAVVSQSVLADCMRKLQLGEFMSFGTGERTTGGARRSSNLASCFEALIGAVYLDGGFEAAASVVLKHLSEKIDWLADDVIKLDYKSALQERRQSHAASSPCYQVMATFGPDHARLFEVTVALGDQNMGHGLGRSKKDAEQRAARMALQNLDGQIAAADEEGPGQAQHTTVYIGVGSNLGEREKYISNGIQRLADLPQTCLVAQSGIFETEPVGEIRQGWFLNLVVALSTALPPLELLKQMRAIEESMGRQRDVPWGPRTIDLDLLLHGDCCMETAELVLPHPRMHERRFVLEPLCQIAPNMQHPRHQQSIQELLAALDDDKMVRHLSDA